MAGVRFPCRLLSRLVHSLLPAVTRVTVQRVWVRLGHSGHPQLTKHASMAAQPTSSSNDKITSAINHSNRCLDVTWENGESTSFPFVYLRDNCPCEECFHPTSLARIIFMCNFDLNIEPKSFQINDSEVTICWSDGHQSSYRWPWLKERDFSSAHKYSDLQALEPQYELWDGDIETRLHRVKHSTFLTSEVDLHAFLAALLKDGLALIEDAPLRTGILQEVLHAVGYPRSTHYGHATFHIKTRMAANNLAYTPRRLEPHVDVPIHDYVPGSQFFHCIQQHQGEGGENHLVDGFQVAHQLKQEDPEAYHILVNTPVVFEDRGVDDTLGEFHKVLETRTFVFDHNGNMKRINFNNFSRSSFLPAKREQVVPLYRALKMFNDYCYQKRNLFTLKLREGDIIAMNNIRVLHGREEYSPLADGERYLEGGYVDWDELLSRMRVLKKRLLESATSSEQ